MSEKRLPVPNKNRPQKEPFFTREEKAKIGLGLSAVGIIFGPLFIGAAFTQPEVWNIILSAADIGATVGGAYWTMKYH